MAPPKLVAPFDKKEPDMEEFCNTSSTNIAPPQPNNSSTDQLWSKLPAVLLKKSPSIVVFIIEGAKIAPPINAWLLAK